MTVFEMNSAVDRALTGKGERVACYVRVSTQEQKLHGLSLDAQKMKLTEYAKKHNMKIVGWYLDEGVSGRKLIRRRPELQRMIQDAEKGLFDRIIFIKLDRFFRSVAEYHECMKRIAPVTWSTTEEQYDLTTANGRMLVNMKLTIAELEADQTGERISIVNEYKVQTGQPLVGDQSQPFGFKNGIDETTGRKNVIRDPDTEDAMEDLLDYVFTHQSVRKAVTYLHAKHNISIAYNSLSRLLKNTMLCGEYRDNKHYCEAYLSREKFDRLQAIVNHQVKQNTANRDYLFSGLVRCPKCGRKMSGSPHTTIKPNGKRYTYKKYKCPGYYLEGVCTFKTILFENTLEKTMLANIEAYLEDAKIKASEVTDANEARHPQHDVEAIHEQIDRLNYSWQTGKIRKVEQYEAQYAELMEKLEAAEAEQGEVAVKDFSKVETILQGGWKDIYKALDDEHKRAFWRSFIQEIVINDKKEVVGVKFF